MKRSCRLALSIVFSLATLTLAARPAAGQTSSQDLVQDHGAWFMVFGQGSFAALNPDLRSLRWWFDGQIRFLVDSDGYDQGVLRPGIGYAVASEITVWLGYAYVHTDPGERPLFYENRLWQQLLWSTSFEQVGFQSRTRLEQRFPEIGSDTGWRFRQFIKLTYPFDFEPRLGLAGYLEAFLDLNDTDWGAAAGFAQSRFFAALFWRLDENGRATLEIGYLNQYLADAIGSDTMNHILSVNLLLSPN